MQPSRLRWRGFEPYSCHSPRVCLSLSSAPHRKHQRPDQSRETTKLRKGKWSMSHEGRKLSARSHWLRLILIMSPFASQSEPQLRTSPGMHQRCVRLQRVAGSCGNLFGYPRPVFIEGCGSDHQIWHLETIQSEAVLLIQRLEGHARGHRVVPRTMSSL